MPGIFQSTDPAPAEPEGKGILEGMHILVAEDNEINAEILQELLLMEGATCEVAVNGSQAVKRFAESKQGEFDAVLMDVQMPVLNGYEATKQIRSLARADAQTIPHQLHGHFLRRHGSVIRICAGFAHSRVQIYGLFFPGIV